MGFASVVALSPKSLRSNRGARRRLSSPHAQCIYFGQRVNNEPFRERCQRFFKLIPGPQGIQRCAGENRVPPELQLSRYISTTLGEGRDSVQPVDVCRPQTVSDRYFWPRHLSLLLTTTISTCLCLFLADSGSTNMPWATAGVLKNAQFGPDGIMYYDVVNGRGRSIQCGDRVAAHIDVFANGIEVDTTRDGQGLAARPKAWDLCTEGTGPGAALRGLDLGVRGMRVGGKRVIDVPPELAYGNRGRGPLIPPNTPLRIKVTMLSAKKWGTNPNVSPPGSSVY